MLQPMTLKELTIKRGLRAENALRYIDNDVLKFALPAEAIIDHVRKTVTIAIDDITNMITEFEESNNVHNNKPSED